MQELKYILTVFIYLRVGRHGSVSLDEVIMGFSEYPEASVKEALLSHPLLTMLQSENRTFFSISERYMQKMER